MLNPNRPICAFAICYLTIGITSSNRALKAAFNQTFPFQMTVLRNYLSDITTKPTSVRVSQLSKVVYENVTPAVVSMLVYSARQKRAVVFPSRPRNPSSLRDNSR